jgi:ribose transport system substrate-binding protein
MKSRSSKKASRRQAIRLRFLLLLTLGAAASLLIVLLQPAGSAARSAAPPQGAALVTASKRVVGWAVAGLVAPKDPSKNQLKLDVSDFIKVTKWTGPTQPSKAPTGKKVAVISCASVAPACKNNAMGAVHAAQALGWQATYIDGKASIQGYVTAFQTALNMNPDAIVTVALPESQLQTYIAKAHAKKIPVVGITLTREKIANPNGHYDSYPTFREDENALLEATWVIADSNGTAHIGFLWDPGYPFLVNELHLEQALFKRCTGCKVEEVAYRDFATAGNPVRMQALATALLQRHPDMNYVLCPYGINCQSVALAAKALGRSNVKVVSKNADAQNVSLVHQGVLAAEVGGSTEWSGWSAIDDVVRFLNHQKVLGLAGHNLPIHIFVKSNAPASGVYDYSKFFNFKAQYLKLWGRR